MNKEYPEPKIADRDLEFYKVLVKVEGKNEYMTPHIEEPVNFGEVYTIGNGREIHYTVDYRKRYIIEEGAFHLLETKEDADRYFKDTFQHWKSPYWVKAKNRGLGKAIVPKGTPYVLGNTPNWNRHFYGDDYEPYKSVATLKVRYEKI